MKISDIDSNLKIKSSVSEKNVRFFNASEKPFSVHGVFVPDKEENYYRRMPHSAAKQVNAGVEYLAKNTAGGRVRFRTDSPYVAIRAEYPEVCVMNHMAQCGIQGFSLYADDVFVGSFIPDRKKKYEGIIYLPKGKMRNITIYFPLYNSLSKLYIGLDKGSEILEEIPYKIASPVVFYGSSITQGGCASRPGTDYEGFLSRALGCDYLNLGFSGSAKGEIFHAQYIAGLDMSAFVMDYDHNAPNAEHLEKTHEAFFKEFRKAKPDTPVIFISRPELPRTEDREKRFAVIKKTYDNAVVNGDKNVYLIDGGTFFKDSEFNDATVDNCHPTDFGFYLMAKGIEPVLANCIL